MKTIVCYLPNLHRFTNFVIHITFAHQSVHDCIKRISMSHMVHFFLPLQSKLQLVLGSEGGSIVEVFNVAHTQAVDKMSDISFIPKAFNPRVEEKRPKGRANNSCWIFS